MAQTRGNRNQKQAAKAAKRKAAVAGKKLGESLASSLAGRIAAAAACPVDRCLRTGILVEAGIGQIVMARRLSSGQLAAGFFLVDILCMGVKDAFFRELTPSELDDLTAANDPALIDTDPAFARKIILGAVAFASDCGVAPARDYARIVQIFGDIDPSASSETVPYGRDGQPVFIPGPKDSLTRIREVEKALLRARGPEGFDIDVAPADRAVMAQIFDRLASVARPDDDPAEHAEDGLVIDHEGSTAVDPA